MICRCFGQTFDLSAVRSAIGVIAGLPDYDRYLAHWTQAHPGEPAMSRDAFVRARQDARFGAGGGLRCC